MNQEEPRREDELRDAALLKKLGKAQPFDPPDGYFEKFSNELKAELDETRLPESLEAIKKLGKEEPFQVPEGYFANFSDRLDHQLEESDLTKHLADQGLKDKSHPFKVPGTYFEKLPAILAQKVQSGGTIRSLWRQSRYAIGIAASIVILISLGIGLSGPANEDPFANFSESEMMAFIDIEAVDTDLILEVLDEIPLAGDTDTDFLPEAEIIDEFLQDMDVQDLEAILDDADWIN